MRQFTETGIKMVEKAVEIQRLKPNPKDENPADLGSVFSLRGKIVLLVEDNDTGWWMIGDYHQMDYAFEEAIWLPLEHQLWEMLGMGLWAKSLAFEYFLREEKTYDIKEYPYQFNSLWQLLLAFLMHEKYGKVWDFEKEDWVTTK
jgi:hypothetical protein